MHTEEKQPVSLADFTMPHYNEIPDVGLYLKQVVKYINETLGPWLNITVTETMLSNYVKMHMLPNAIKKQYYRDQIVVMIFIVLAKTCVSLENIQKLLKMREKHYDIKKTYAFVAETLEKTMRSFFGSGETEEEEEGSGLEKETAEEEMTDDRQLLVKNIIIAIVQKYYIEKCLEMLDEEAFSE